MEVSEGVRVQGRFMSFHPLVISLLQIFVLLIFRVALEMILHAVEA
jgi:hypothetical protein